MKGWINDELRRQLHTSTFSQVNLNLSPINFLVKKNSILMFINFRDRFTVPLFSKQDERLLYCGPVVGFAGLR